MLWGEAVRHACWLKNRTSTKALDGKTPYEALTGRKPNLRNVREWGSRIWVHSVGGSKLDMRAREGRWVGIDNTSKGVRVYWPESRTVTVERNVYSEPLSSARLEGERLDVPDAQDELAETPDTTPDSPTATTPLDPIPDLAVPSPPSPIPLPVPEPAEERSRRVRMPSRYVRDLREGLGVTLARPSEQGFARGLQVPDAVAEDAGDVGAVDAGWDGLEYALVAEASEAEALEPRTLAEARRRPDW
ncbi:hypothetical protein BV25DRAFT_1807234, partial [Artomyces pyxidatus]